MTEHLLSWPPVRCPSQRVCDIVTQICVRKCTFARARECMHVGIWGFAAVVVLLLAAHCSLSLCPSRFMGLLFSLSEQCCEIYVLGHKPFSGYKLGWMIPVSVALPSARRFYIPESRIIVIRGFLLIFYEEFKKDGALIVPYSIPPDSC